MRFRDLIEKVNWNASPVGMASGFKPLSSHRGRMEKGVTLQGDYRDTRMLHTPSQQGLPGARKKHS